MAVFARKKHIGANMQVRKELRRLKRLNIYHKDFTSTAIIRQMNRTLMIGSVPADSGHWGCTLKL